MEVTEQSRPLRLLSPIVVALLTAALSLVASSIEGASSGYLRAVHITTNVLRDLQRLTPSMSLRIAASDAPGSPPPKMRKLIESAELERLPIWSKAQGELDWIAFADGDLSSVTSRIDTLIAKRPGNREEGQVEYGVMEIIQSAPDVYHTPKEPSVSEMTWIDGVMLVMVVAEAPSASRKSERDFVCSVFVTSPWNSLTLRCPVQMEPSAEPRVREVLVHEALGMIALADLREVGPRGGSSKALKGGLREVVLPHHAPSVGGGSARCDSRT